MLPEFSPSHINNRAQLIMSLRKFGIRDARLLEAMERIPRELFVDEPFSGHAYDDTALPIACGQTLSQPTVVAFMTQALELEPRHRVLEIGTGSGYQAAILAKLTRRVYTVERHKELLALAEARFATLNLTNMVTKRGDGSKGWKEAAPFERIMATAAAETMPQILVDQLSPGGVMVIPIGADAHKQHLIRLRKHANGEVSSETLIPVRFVPLVNGL